MSRLVFLLLVITGRVPGGRWVPRKKLEEAAVAVDDRAWLPFLSARHPLFRVAARLSRQQAH